MIIREIKKQAVDISLLKKRTAFESDTKELIQKDCIITENGSPVIFYKTMRGEETADLKRAVKEIKYQAATRTSGMRSFSATFGYSPRRVLRGDFCRATVMAANFPIQHNIIAEFSNRISRFYEEYFPDTYKKHLQITEDKILPEWRMGKSLFTSGIINKDNPLPYHHDGGNFKGVLSNMIAFKSGIKGGRLSCPEYNIKFETDDNTILIFDGQKILHGVTPINKITPKAYRYTIVYYTLEQMWNCKTVKEELVRIRQTKKKREFKRLL